MAITGTWKAAQRIQAGPTKWGTGINPVHGAVDNTGRQIAVTPQQNVISDDVTEQYDPVDGYTDEDSASILYGYNDQTGTAERPPVGTEDNRLSANGFPSWGKYTSGVPGGTQIRAENKGADITNTAKQTPDEDVAQGWLNKATGKIAAANVSDDSQLYMQTSMTQRNKVRSGSQIAGTASEYDSPIESRVVGQKVKQYSGEQRHSDMFPRQQDMIIRPFWDRNAGTGYREWLYPNAMYQSEPLYRQAPPDPYQGDTVPSSEYGYSAEDVMY